MKTYNLLENDKFAEIINKQSRLIGIDHGKKNIGISICDENHNIATPLTTIEFKQLKFFITEIRNIIQENNIEGIIVVTLSIWMVLLVQELNQLEIFLKV